MLVFGGAVYNNPQKKPRRLKNPRMPTWQPFFEAFKGGDVEAKAAHLFLIDLKKFGRNTTWNQTIIIHQLGL